jgi:hypothetical protein
MHHSKYPTSHPRTRATLRRSPSAPPCNFKPQFRLGFNNSLRSALTLRGWAPFPSAWETNRGSTQLHLNHACWGAGELA